jgi:hypothetical protein
LLSEVLFVGVLRPSLARGLPSWASVLTWVVSCVSKLALSAPFVSEFACFKPLPALPFGKIYKNVYISAISPNLKEKIFMSV